MNAEMFAALILIALLILVVGLVLSYIAIRTMRSGTFVSKEAELNNEVKKLQAALEIMNRDRLQDAERIRRLESDLIIANTRIRELEAALSRYERQDNQRSERPLLVGVGNDAALQIDLAVLRAVKTKSGLNFTRLLPLTFEKFHNVIANARLHNKPIRYIHLAVHADSKGLRFDRLITAVELSAELQDVQVLVIAGCESEDVGTYLGVVPYVVTMREKINHDDAARFTEAFWTAIGNSADPEDAFYDALDRVPNVQEFAQLHC